jgi:hypothetical protein
MPVLSVFTPQPQAYSLVMNFKKLFWHRLAIALAILVAWSLLVVTMGASMLAVLILIGALAGTFFKDLTSNKAKNWRWFTVQAGVFLLAYFANFLILPFTVAAVPKGQSPDFIATANTGLAFVLLALIIFTLCRIGAEGYRAFAARTFK